MKKLDQVTKDTIFKLDYSIHTKNIKLYALVGIIGHLVFYILLGKILGYKDFLSLRLLIIGLYLVFVFMSERKWQLSHKLFFEFGLWFSLPFYFMFMLFANNVDVKSSTSLIFVALIYAMLSKSVICIPAHILTFLFTIPIYRLFFQLDENTIIEAVSIVFVSWLTLILISLFKIKVESSYNRHNKLKLDAERLNETFSSLIYVSSELSMYDDLDTIYHMLIERLVYMFPGSSLALIISKDDDYNFINQVYHEVGNQDQMLIKKYFSHLIDPYALKKEDVITDKMNEELQVIKEWLVFTKTYDIRTHEKLTRYDISLFLRNTHITDNEINIFNIFMEQFKGSIRTRFQAIELERYATTDPLTNLYNRNSYYEDINKCTDFYDEKDPFSIIFGDVNSLKYINDTYGHTDGDLLLQTCSDLLRSILPDQVKAYRFGGDEMVMILKSTDLKGAKKMVDQLKAAFKNKNIICTNESTHEQKVEPVSMCFGAACSTETDFSELIDLADSRMMIEKELYYQQENHKRYR